MTVNTPNMNLIESTIGVDSGLQWEENLNASLTIIDQHNHSPGYGVPITPAGININSDLDFANNSGINLKSLVLEAQSSVSTNLAVYAVGANLYFNDGNSNVIQLTSGGAVNATSSGISNGTASASFVASVLVVNAAASTPANIQGGSVLLGNNSASSKFLTLSPPAAMPANFALTLPNVPAQTNLVTLDTSGNFAATANVDNSTLQFSANTLAIKAQGVTQGLLAARATGSTVGAGGFGITSSCGLFTTASTSPVNVTNFSITITTTGRPVRIEAQSDGTAFAAGIVISGNGGSNAQAVVYILRAASAISEIGINVPTNGGSIVAQYPPSAISFTDIVAAGTYTYTVQVNCAANATAVQMALMTLTAYEI